jgi:plasmid stability protein
LQVDIKRLKMLSLISTYPAMANLTVRNLPDEVHRALRLRAAQNGRSTEAEIRFILENSVCPPQRLLLGSALAQLGRDAGLTNRDVEALEGLRDRTPAEPLRLA